MKLGRYCDTRRLSVCLFTGYLKKLLTDLIPHLIFHTVSHSLLQNELLTHGTQPVQSVITLTQYSLHNREYYEQVLNNVDILKRDLSSPNDFLKAVCAN